MGVSDLLSSSWFVREMADRGQAEFPKFRPSSIGYSRRDFLRSIGITALISNYAHPEFRNNDHRIVLFEHQKEFLKEWLLLNHINNGVIGFRGFDLQYVNYLGAPQCRQ